MAFGPSIDAAGAGDRTAGDVLAIRGDVRDPRVAVATVEGLIGSSHHLDVLLRHRSRSISLSPMGRQRQGRQEPWSHSFYLWTDDEGREAYGNVQRMHTDGFAHVMK